MKKFSYFILITLLTFNLFFSSCLAGEKVEQQPAQPQISAEQEKLSLQEEEKKFQKLREESQENVSLFSPVRVFSNLITLVAILCVLAWLYNKYGKDSLNKALAIKKINQNNINVLSTSSIGQGKYLHIVEVHGEKILIGATANNISFLKELTNNQVEKVVSDE